MTIALLVLFTMAGFSWGLAVSPFQKPITTNYFKLQMPDLPPPPIVKHDDKLVKEVKTAKANLNKLEKGNA